MHDLGFKTKRAEFVLSPLFFTTSRKTIITPYSYASIRNLSAVTSCICAPTCRPSNGQSFNFPFLNIKRHSIPPFQLPPINHFFTPLPSLHSSLKPLTFQRLAQPPFFFSRYLFFSSFQILLLHFLVLHSGSLYTICVLCFSLHPAPSFSITLTYFKKKPLL